MRRELFRGWLRLGWHVDGMTWPQYLQLTRAERYLVHDELSDLIDRVEGPRPKDMR